MAKKTMLEQARSAYNKNQNTKGGQRQAKKNKSKTRKKKEKTVSSSWDSVRDKTQTAGKSGATNRKNANLKTIAKNNAEQAQNQTKGGAFKPVKTNWGEVSDKARNTKGKTTKVGKIGEGVIAAPVGSFVYHTAKNATDAAGWGSKQAYRAKDTAGRNKTHSTTRNDRRTVGQQKISDIQLNEHKETNKKTQIYKTDKNGNIKTDKNGNPVLTDYGKGQKEYAKPFKKASKKLEKKQDETLEHGAKALGLSDEKKYNIPDVPILNKFLPSTEEQQKQTRNSQLKAAGLDKKSIKKTLDEIDAYANEQGFTADTLLENGKTYGEYRKELEAGMYADRDSAINAINENMDKEGVGKFSATDIYKGGNKALDELADYLIPYGGSTKAALKAAEGILKAGKGVKAGKALTTLGEDAVKGLSKGGKKYVREAVENGLKNGENLGDIIKNISKTVSKSNLKQNVKKELIANAIQDATLGTTIDALKGKQQGLKGDEFKKYMAENAAMNAAFGMPISMIAGRTGKAGKRAINADITRSINEVTDLSKAEGTELKTLLRKQENNTISAPEEAKLAELQSKAFGSQSTAVGANGKVVVKNADTAVDALSTEEAKQYLRLKAKSASGTLKEKEASGFARLQRKVENAYKQTETVSNKVINLNASSIKSADLKDAETAVKFFERTGDTAKLKVAQKALETAKVATRNLNESLDKAVKTMTEKTGIEYKWVTGDEMRALGADEDSVIKGFTHFDENGKATVLINRESPQAWQTVIGHETMHLIKKSNEKVFNDLGDALTKYAKEIDEYNELEAVMRRNYPEFDAKSDDFKEEMISEMLGRYVFGENDKFIKRLAGENPTALEKIVDYIKNLVKKSKNPELAEQFNKFIDSADEAIRAINKDAVAKNAANESKLSKATGGQKYKYKGKDYYKQTIDDYTPKEYYHHGWAAVHDMLTRQDRERLETAISDKHLYQRSPFQYGDKYYIPIEQHGDYVKVVKTDAVLGDYSIESVYVFSSRFDKENVEDIMTLFGKFDDEEGGLFNVDEINEIYGKGGQPALTEHRPQDYPYPAKSSGRGKGETSGKDINNPKAKQNGGGSNKGVKPLGKASKEKPANAGSFNGKSSTRFDTEENINKYLTNKAKSKTKAKTIRAYKNGENVVLRSDDEINNYIDKTLNGDDVPSTVGYGIVPDKLSTEIKAFDSGVDTSGYFLEFNRDDLRHAFNEHEKPKVEGDLPISKNEMRNIPMWIDKYDHILEVRKRPDGVSVKLGKRINGYSVVVGLISDSRLSMRPKTVWKMKTEKYLEDYAEQIKKHTDLVARTSESEMKGQNLSTTTGNASKNKITEISETVKGKASKEIAHREEMLSDAEESYGAKYTEDFNETGFIFPDGKLPKMGEYGQRADDHAIVISLYDDIDYSTHNAPKSAAMGRFLDEGNIRIMPENGSIEMSAKAKPTQEQFSAIRRFLNEHDEAEIEFSGIDGRSVDSKRYTDGINPEQVVNDIKRFYSEGKIGGSDLNNFRFSKEAKANDAIEALTKNSESAEAFSKAERKEITDALDEISKALEDGDMSTARSMADDLANKYGKIDEEFKTDNPEFWGEVKGAQSTLQKQVIHLDPGMGSLKYVKEHHLGDYNSRNLRVRMSQTGKVPSKGIDEVWEELCEDYPSVFSREITSPEERLERLGEVSSMRKSDTMEYGRFSDEEMEAMHNDMVDDILNAAEKNVKSISEDDYYNRLADDTIAKAEEVVNGAKKEEPPKAEKPKTKKPAKKEKPKEPEKTEVQKLQENNFASDDIKTALNDIEKAGAYKAEEVEKKAKKFNELDRQIAGKTRHIENAKKSEKYASEAERAERIAELEADLKSLKNKQAKVAGEIEQMGKMKAVDKDRPAGEQIKELRGGNNKVNKEVRNNENLTQTDSWIKDKWNSVRRLWEDSLIDVENTAKASGDKELRQQILTAANRVRNSMSVANNWITKVRSKFDNTVGGKALDEIFNKELIDNEPKYADFQEYLIMKHVPARHAKGTDIYPEISPALAEKRVKELEDKYRPKDADGNPLLDKDGKPVRSEVEEWADDVYGYLKDLQQYRVDSGMLSQEAADQFAKDYPFYVPTNRVNDSSGEIDFFTGGMSNGIRSAKGGENEVLDIYSQIYTATNKTIHAAEENQMLNLYFKAKGVTDAQIKDATLDDLEHAVIEANVNKKTGASTVSFFIDGKAVKLPCNHQLALGLRELDGLEFERLLKASKVATLYGKPFKALITDWNLVFGVRNGARDLQQALVNSKDTRFFASSTGAAAHAVAHEDSPFRKLYASMGGEQAQLVSYDAVAKQMGIEKHDRVDAIHEKVQDFVDFEVKGKHVNPIHYIEGINGAIEMMPRMCEFIGTLRKDADKILRRQGSSLKQLRKDIIAEVDALEKAGKVGKTDVSAEVENRLAERIIDMVGKDSIDTAMRNANDITLNFGRNGVLGKALNMGFVPYLNPSIQGLSKLIRLFSEAGQEGGWKALTSIGMKLGTFTIAPAVFNELALRDNEDYQNLNTRDKDNNFFIPLSIFGDDWDGKFFKFPKPRENAVLAEPVEYGLRYFLDDTEYAFFDWSKMSMETEHLWDKIPLTEEGKQAFRTAVDNIGVINPATSNMLSPIMQTFNNKTWYGGSIESAYETSINEETGKANVPVNERYDVGTSGIAIWLGQTKGAKALNLSPKKIDNLLDSYTGMIYDLGISQTTEEAKTRGNWLFRTMASQFVKDSVFSNKLSTNAWAKMDGMPKKEQDKYKSTYMYDTFKYDDAQDLITSDKTMTAKEKMEAKRALQIAKNKLNREAIDGKENTSNPLVDIAKHLGATKTLNHFLPDTGGEDTDTWTDYFKTYKKAKGYSGLTKAQKDKQSQKFLDVYSLGVKGQLIQDPTKFHDSPSWGMTGVAAAQLAKQGKLKGKDADLIMKSCGVYDSQTEVYHNYTEFGGNVKRYAITEKRVGKTLDKVGDWGMDTKSGLWKGTFDKSMGAKGGTIAMSLATSKKVDFKDRAYYIANSSDPQMLDKMNAARGFSEKYGHKTKEISKLALQADALGDGNTYLKNDEIINVCNKMKGNSEEKSMAYVLLGGKPGKNPFGEIGDYSHDGDTGIQTLAEDGKSGGRGRRGRRRGRGGGGGGSGGGTPYKALINTAGGAAKQKITKIKVTDVSPNSDKTKPSNLDDAYRRRVRKLRKDLTKTVTKK